MIFERWTPSQKHLYYARFAGRTTSFLMGRVHSQTEWWWRSETCRLTLTNQFVRTRLKQPSLEVFTRALFYAKRRGCTFAEHMMPEDGAALRGGLLAKDAAEAHARALSHRGGRCGRAVQLVSVGEAHVARGHPHLCTKAPPVTPCSSASTSSNTWRRKASRLTAVVSASVSFHFTPLGGR